MITILPIGNESVDRFMDIEPKSKDSRSYDKPSDNINQAMQTKVNSSYKEKSILASRCKARKTTIKFLPSSSQDIPMTTYPIGPSLELYDCK